MEKECAECSKEKGCCECMDEESKKAFAKEQKEGEESRQ